MMPSMPRSSAVTAMFSQLNSGCLSLFVAMFAVVSLVLYEILPLAVRKLALVSCCHSCTCYLAQRMESFAF